MIILIIEIICGQQLCSYHILLLHSCPQIELKFNLKTLKFTSFLRIIIKTTLSAKYAGKKVIFPNMLLISVIALAFLSLVSLNLESGSQFFSISKFNLGFTTWLLML